MTKFKYFKVENWMLEELEFKTLTQMTVFAIIYGFKNHEYIGGRNYLATLTLCDVRTIDRVLDYLVKKEYIFKRIIKRKYGSFRGYTAVKNPN